MFRRLKPYQLWVDLGLAAVSFLLACLSYALVSGYVSVATVFGMAVAFAVRRLNPGLALGFAWVSAVVLVSLGSSPDVSNIAIVPVLFATSAYGSRLVKWLGFASTIVGAAIIAIYLVALPALSSGVAYEPDGRLDPALWQAAANTLALFVATLAVFLLSWVCGQLFASYSVTRESRRAQATAEWQQLRAREDVMVEQERVRIARDMHDVVAHSLAVVIAQADGARYARAADPAAVDSALTAISATAREALGDVRILLGQLRHGQEQGPTRALDDIAPLVERFRSSGLPIEWVTEGRPGPLPMGQQLALYRIVQESLTNALRHGDVGSTVVIRVRWRDDTVAVDITSALLGPPPEQLRAGHGLAGMRERAVLVGGAFSAGSAGSSFVVSATVPRVVTTTTPSIGIPA